MFAIVNLCIYFICVDIKYAAILWTQEIRINGLFAVVFEELHQQKGLTIR